MVFSIRPSRAGGRHWEADGSAEPSAMEMAETRRHQRPHPAGLAVACIVSTELVGPSYSEDLAGRLTEPAVFVGVIAFRSSGSVHVGPCCRG